MVRSEHRYYPSLSRVATTAAGKRSTNPGHEKMSAPDYRAHDCLPLATLTGRLKQRPVQGKIVIVLNGESRPDLLRRGII